MSGDCERWIALSDREALGEALNADEHRFIADHAQDCDSCAAEALVWRGIEGLVTEDEAAPEVEPLRSHRAPRRLRFWERRAFAWGVTAGAAAAVAALWFGLRRPEPPKVAVAPPVRARLTVITRDAELDGRPAVIGAALVPGSVVRTREGTACLGLEHGVRACVLPGSAVKVADVGEHRKLEIQVGKLVADLDTQTPGTSFSVVTRDGSVTAVGTSFSVEVPADGAPMVARVLHGAVLVNGPRGEQHALSAHAEVVIGEAPRPLPPEAERMERAAVHDAMLLAGGTHVLPLEPPPVTEEVVATPQAREAPAPVRTTKSPPSLVAEASAAPDATRERPSELLLRARAARGHGDLAEAARLYRELTANHPSSAEAHAVQVSLGDVLLSSGDAEGALAAFTSYQRRGGPLAQEAAYGKIRALRALGHATEERAAILAFFETYPQAPQVPSLRARLSSLEE